MTNKWRDVNGKPVRNVDTRAEVKSDTVQLFHEDGTPARAGDRIVRNGVAYTLTGATQPGDTGQAGAESEHGGRTWFSREALSEHGLEWRAV